MSELEAAGADSLGDLFRRRKPPHGRPPGSSFVNCDTVLQGPCCHACGQDADDYHRSISHLIGEAFEGLLHFDGRLWQTLPRLFLRPATLTAAYVAGKRVPQIPPFRLFLIVILIVFFSAHSAGNKPVGLNIDPAQRADAIKSVPKVEVHIAGVKSAAASEWLKDRLKLAIGNPEKFEFILEAWAHRLAILMLPISALTLSCLFLFQRKYLFYDHLIFSMHSLSVLSFILSTTFLLRTFMGGIAEFLFLLPPVHLFMHMRGFYQRSVFGTLIRMLLLFVISVVGFCMILLLLLGIGLNELGGH